MVSEANLPSLYARCDVFLFPSFYEGFGWPVLEAMACGTPVVRSTWPSLGEITGGHALAADALDYDALADHVVTVLDNKELAVDLAKRGRDRALTFTWSRAAEETRAVYTALAEMPRTASGPLIKGVV